MKLYIDGTEITPRPEQSLYEIVKEMGLLKGSLTADPIAAKIDAVAKQGTVKK